MLAAVVVLAIIIFMFDRPVEPAIRVTPIEIHLSSATVSKQIPLKLKQVQSEKRNKPQAVLKQPHLVKVENIPLKTIKPTPPPPVVWQHGTPTEIQRPMRRTENYPDWSTPIQPGNHRDVSSI